MGKQSDLPFFFCKMGIIKEPPRQKCFKGQVISRNVTGCGGNPAGEQRLNLPEKSMGGSSLGVSFLLPIGPKVT